MRSPSRGVSRLMNAILEDAIGCYRSDGIDAASRRERMEAERWIFFSEDRTSTFSFTRVCATLGIDPAVLRADLILSRSRRASLMLGAA